MKQAINIKIELSTRLLVEDIDNITYDEYEKLISLIRKELTASSVKHIVKSKELSNAPYGAFKSDKPLISIESSDLDVGFSNANHFIEHFGCQELVKVAFGQDALDEDGDLTILNDMDDVDIMKELLKISYNTEYFIDEVEIFGQDAYRITLY